MKQHEVADVVKETPVIKIEKSLLPKKEYSKKSNGIRL